MIRNLEKQIKYIISSSDVEKLSKEFPIKTNMVYQDNGELIMDYSIIKNLKNNFAMNVKIKKVFGNNSFDEWLSEREKPYYVIYKYVSGFLGDSIDIYRVPYDIDFKSDLYLSLSKKTYSKIKGVPTLVEYYEKKQIINASGAVAYTNKICEVRFELKYSSLGFIYQKIALLGWCLSNGECDSVNTKDIGHVYDMALESGKVIKEGVDRRRCIYDELQIPTLSIMSLAMPELSQTELMKKGRAFMVYYKDAFDGFIYESQTILEPSHPDYGMKYIVSAIKNDTTNLWLDTVVNIGFGPVTGREFLMEQMSI